MLSSRYKNVFCPPEVASKALLKINALGLAQWLTGCEAWAQEALSTPNQKPMGKSKFQRKS